MAETNFENATLKLLIEDTNGIVTVASLQQTPATGGSGTPGGSNTQVQFNDTDAFGGFGVWDGDTLIIGSAQIGTGGGINGIGFNSSSFVTAGTTIDANNSITLRSGTVKGLAYINDDQLVIGDTSHATIILSGSSGDTLFNTGAGGLFFTAPGGYDFDGGSATFEFPTTFNDVLQLTPRATPSSPVEGEIYAGTDHHLYYYNGTAWKQLDN